MENTSKSGKKEYFGNWIRAALGLRYLQMGLVMYVSGQVKKQFKNIVKTIEQQTITRFSCNKCSNDTLLPDHDNTVSKKPCPMRKNQKQCFCSDKDKQTGNRRKCPNNNACGLFYDHVAFDHENNDPNWRNVTISKWSSKPWEFAKSFINTPGYDKVESAENTDAAGLLSICINNKRIRKDIEKKKKDVGAFEEARKIRNIILHSGTVELQEDELLHYTNVMLSVLDNLPTGTSTYESVQTARKNLQELPSESVCVNCSRAYEVMKDALREIHRCKMEIMKTIRKETNADENEQMQRALAVFIQAETKHNAIIKECEAESMESMEKFREFRTKLSEQNSDILHHFDTDSLCEELRDALVVKDSQATGGMGQVFDVNIFSKNPVASTILCDRRNLDVYRLLKVTLEDLYNGKTMLMNIERTVTCDGCNGLGNTATACKFCDEHGTVTSEICQPDGELTTDTKACPSCKGQGRAFCKMCQTCSGGKLRRKSEDVTITIEKGMADGSEIRLPGKGDELPGLGTGYSIFILKEEKHVQFGRQGDVLFTRDEISLAEGNSFSLTHLDGRILTITRQANSTNLHVEGGEGFPIQGIPFSKGDLLIRLAHVSGDICHICKQEGCPYDYIRKHGTDVAEQRNVTQQTYDAQQHSCEDYNTGNEDLRHKYYTYQ